LDRSQTETLRNRKKRESVLDKHLKSELEWIRKSPKGRQAKSRARIERYDDLLRSKQKISHYEPGIIVIPPGPRLGDEVICVESISKTIKGFHGEDRVLFKNLNFSLKPGAIVGVVGPNGSGKSTLLNILSGMVPPDSGCIKIGQTVKIGFATQSRDSLNPLNTVFEEISQGLHEITVGGLNIALRKYLASFNFKAGLQDKRIRDLSGGERNRVHLAKMLTSNVNVILMDEPTNDIDIDVLRSLEEGMHDYPGCVIVVSHDRWFLDRVSTHILSFEDGGAIFFEGNYSDYDMNRQERGIKDNFVFKNIVKRGGNW